jgi:CheY-like chemotaxis protein/HPt (histidine-containing phosphotransfer) domain-containing protein
VIVVHPHPSVRTNLGLWLRRWHADPVEAADIETALELLEEPTDAVVVDLATQRDGPQSMVDSIRTVAEGEPLIVVIKPLGTPRPEVADPASAHHLTWINSPVKVQRLLDALRGGFGIAEPLEDVEARSAARDAEPLPSASVRILVVEDNPVNRRLSTMMLDRLGFTASMVESGAEAVAACTSEPFDIVLMDVQMPEMDGFEATRRIRGLDLETPPFIIAITAHAMAGDRERCLAAGMDDYLAKPIQLHELRTALRRAVTTPPPSQDEVGVLDSHRLDQIRSIGKEGLLEDMIELFLDDLLDRVAEIERAVEDRDGEALREGAHTLKGAALALGANPVALVCQDLESAGEGGRMDDATATVARLHLQVSRLREALDSILHGAATS